jgi:hypothetical protein
MEIKTIVALMLAFASGVSITLASLRIDNCPPKLYPFYNVAGIVFLVSAFILLK